MIQLGIWVWLRLRSDSHSELQWATFRILSANTCRLWSFQTRGRPCFMGKYMKIYMLAKQNFVPHAYQATSQSRLARDRMGSRKSKCAQHACRSAAWQRMKELYAVLCLGVAGMEGSRIVKPNIGWFVTRRTKRCLKPVQSMNTKRIYPYRIPLFFKQNMDR